MSTHAFEEMPALAPLNFFTVTTDMHYAKTPLSAKKLKKSHLLPDTTELLGEERFAEMALSWNEEGLQIAVFVDKPFEEASYPRFSEGDALELFFDTRDMKSAGFVTRFCHHFLILPQEVQGIRLLELTHFRTEDTHPLCDPSECTVEAEFETRSYSMLIHIPSSCLHGYDPQQFDRLGFNYRCHRMGGAPQHFSVSSQDYAIEQHPRLWGSLKLVKSR